MVSSLLPALSLLACGALALPLQPRQATDAPYDVDPATLAAAVTCPNGITGAAGGVVFLVHGTGSNGTLTWANGPYVISLPSTPPGFDVCWVDLPSYALTDAQTSAEYIAYNIPRLANQSATGKVSIIGHSQGAGLNPQWALEFWPSTRKYVNGYVALAGDFHGTDEGLLLCTVDDIALGGCEPSVWQQSAGSHYLAAQNSLGGQALVPTTSIYTLEDDVIQPEVVTPTSNLPGASVHALQDADFCGPAHLADHFTMVVDGGAYALAIDAITHGGEGDPTRLDTLTACQNLTGFERVPQLLEGIVVAVIEIGGDTPKTPAEPPLKPYVCAAGAATTCG